MVVSGSWQRLLLHRGEDMMFFNTVSVNWVTLQLASCIDTRWSCRGTHTVPEPH